MASDENGKWIPGTIPEYPDDLSDAVPGWEWPSASKAKESCQRWYDDHLACAKEAFLYLGIDQDAGAAERYALAMCNLEKPPQQMTVREYAELRGLPVPLQGERP